MSYSLSHQFPSSASIFSLRQTFATMAATCLLRSFRSIGLSRKPLYSVCQAWRSREVGGLRHSSSATRIQRLGEHPYGTREYRLTYAAKADGENEPAALASLRAHRNIVFGARVQSAGLSLVTTCHPLLVEAVQDAGANGEQPQALATLHGLCDWVVQQGLDPDSSLSDTIRSLSDVRLEAVRAIATGIPREGHSVVGAGTHRDAGDAWEKLAREFIQAQAGVDAADEEFILYHTNGGQLVTIELLADTNPEYLRSAGGAMARFFMI